MLNIFSKRIADLMLLESAAAQSNAAIGLYRIIMQHGIVSLYEWCINRIRATGVRPESVELPLTEVRRPTDGGMITAMAELLVAAENLGWKNVSNPWWETFDTSRPCARILGSSQKNIDGLLSSYVRRRNDGLGHGIPGGYEPDADADLLRLLLEATRHILPTHLGATNKLVLEGGGGAVEIQSLKLFNGDPILYREIKPIGSAKSRVSAQILRPNFEREDVKYEIDDVFGREPPKDVQGLQFFSTYDPRWNPLGRIPDRPTLEFSGREVELARLRDWFDDAGSRACLIFGDGGVGKTTLLIEFLHRCVTGISPVAWRPEAIFYYTAKQTQWTVDGVRYIGVPRTGLSDSLRNIPSDVEGALGREWFGLNIVALSSKVESFLAELGLKKENVLLVIDNAETLTRSEADVDVLAEELNQVVRKVGRVLLTSRRRERIEAKQIQVEALLESDALSMLRARGKALSKKQINDAGDATLRQFCRKLGCKPISIEVFVSAVEPGGSLDHAFQRVTRLQHSELGEFLFADAWHRMSSKVRTLLLLMTRLSDVHDEVLLKLACQECGVSVREAEDAFEESLGIATLTRAAGHLTIAFSDDFRRYCKDRFEQVGAEKLPTDEAEQKVAARYSTYLRGVKTQLPSKDAAAFRHATARAAYAAAADGKVADAIIFYEEAVLVDSENPFLWDRYAFYLVMQRRLPEALDKAVRAARIAPNDPNIQFTKGMIEARMGDVVAATKSLGLAAAKGMQEHRCWLGRAYANFNAVGRNLDQVEHCLENARTKCPANASQRAKHLDEVTKLQMRLVRERKRAIA